MKNPISLHEAVVIVLLKKPHRTATFEAIAKETESENCLRSARELLT